MEPLMFVIAFVLGVVAATAGGILSGLYLGKEALGAELAAYMGGIYGFLAGAMAVMVGLVALMIV